MRQRVKTVVLWFGLFVLTSLPQLSRAQDAPQMVLQSGHASQVANLWLSPDEKNLVSQSDDRIIIWDTTARRVLRTIENEEIYDISPNGAYLATTNGGTNFTIWEIKTGNKRHEITQSVESIFSLSSEYIFGKGAKGSIAVVDFKNDTYSRKFKLAGTIPGDFAVGAGNKIVVSSRSEVALDAGADAALNYLEVFDVTEDAALFTLRNQTEWSVSADGTKLVALDQNKTARVYDLAANYKKLFETESAGEWKLSPQGKHFISLRGETLTIRNIADGSVKLSRRDIALDELNFSPNEKYIYIKQDGVLSIFSFKDPDDEPQIIENVEESYFSPDDQFAVVSTKQDDAFRLTLWDLSAQKIVFDAPVTEMAAQKVVFSRDSRRFLAQISVNGVTRLSMRSTADGRETVLGGNETKNLPTEIVQLMEMPLEPPSTLMTVINPNLTVNPSNGKTKTLYISLKGGNKRPSVEKFADFGGETLIFSASGKTVAHAAHDVAVALFDTSNGKRLPPLENHISPVEFSLSADKKSLIVANDGLERLWNLQTGGFVPAPKSPKKAAPVFWWETYDIENEDESYVIKHKKTGSELIRKTGVSICEPSDDLKFLACRKTVEDEEYYTLEVTDLRTKRVIFRIPKVVESFDFDNPTFSADSQKIFVLRDAREGTDEDLEGNKRLEIWSSRGVLLYASPKGFGTFAFDEGWKNILLGFEDRLEFHNTKTKEFKKFVFSGDFYVSAERKKPFTSAGGKIIGFTSAEDDEEKTIYWWNTEKNRVSWRTEHSARILNAEFTPDERFLVTSSADGSINVWSIAQEKLLLTFVPLGKNDWLVYDDEGNFDFSNGAARLLEWRADCQLHNFEQIKTRYAGYIKERYVTNLWRKKMAGN